MFVDSQSKKIIFPFHQKNNSALNLTSWNNQTKPVIFPSLLKIFDVKNGYNRWKQSKHTCALNQGCALHSVTPPLPQTPTPTLAQSLHQTLAQSLDQTLLKV